jgi:hypothetical protein
MNNSNLLKHDWLAIQLAVIFSFLCFSASATVLLQEGFGYSDGVLGNNPPWTTATSLITVTNTSLSYANLTAVSPNNSVVISAGTAAASYRPIGGVLTSGTVYYSCLVNFSSLGGSYYISGLTQATNATPAGSAADPLDLVDKVSGSGYALGIRGKGVTGSYGAALEFNATYFLVLKYDFASGAVALYVNPAPGGPEPVTPYASNSGATVPDLTYLYLRSGSSSAGLFRIGNLRVGTSWSDVTPATVPAGVLVFSTPPPPITTAGDVLAAISVQLQDGVGNNLASNNIPVSLRLNGATFASGTTIVNTDAAGLATFSDLIVTNAGSCTMTAIATDFGSVSSGDFIINPATIDHYSITVPPVAWVGQPFTLSGVAQDLYNNTVTTDDSTLVGLGSSTGNVIFDSNRNGIFGQSGDSIATLAGGTFSLNAQDNQMEMVSVGVSDASGRTGTSGPVNIGTNGISAQGTMLGNWLLSLQVDKYWLVGRSVNWLTGAPGGSGPNMTAGTSSHCSAFAAAAAELLGVYLLRPPDASDINLANHQADWLEKEPMGWFNIPSMLDAQRLANAGLLVVASYKSSSGSGHISILRPSNRTDASITTYGPQECQSGTYNYADTNVITGFNQHPGAFPNGIRYYGHAISYPLPNITPALGPGALSNQTFGMVITNIVGRIYQIQSSSNLMNWSVLRSYTNSNNSSDFFVATPFSDSIAGSEGKFYRVLAQ